MHPSADAVPQLFSISADIRGCLKKPKLRMRIIRGCRCVYAYLFSLNSTTLEHLKYTISLLSVHMIVVITFASGAAVVKLICLPCHHIYSVLLTKRHQWTSLVSSAVHAMHGVLYDGPTKGRFQFIAVSIISTPNKDSEIHDFHCNREFSMKLCEILQYFSD